MNEADRNAEVLAALRRDDRDRYLCALAAPASLRDDLAALYLFNAEVAGIAEKVSEPMLGLIRLQWWRDAFGEIAGNGMAAERSHRHPLVQNLADISARRDLDLASLGRILDARERDLDAAQPEDLAALEAHVAATAGSLCEVAVSLCVTGADPELRRIARQVGTAYGLIGQMRAVPYLARCGRVMVPASIMTEAQSSSEALRKMKPDRHLPRAVAAVTERAAALIEQARRTPLQRGIRAGAMAALLPGRLAMLQLERLRRHGYDPFVPEALAPSGLDIWRLLAARWLGRL
ncbi:MAG: squalene/phytoene synthase family protein [Rhodospirillaceae bacterium]|nr:squalene/phytoene synthase family protein [Rhodospirillaceae bacterium]